MKLPYDDQRLIMKALVLGGGTTRSASVGPTFYSGKSIIYHRSTKIGLDTIMDDNKFKYTVRMRRTFQSTWQPGTWSHVSLHCFPL